MEVTYAICVYIDIIRKGEFSASVKYYILPSSEFSVPILDHAFIVDDEPNQALLKKTRVYVNHFAKDGLRTLCMAKKVQPWKLLVTVAD